MMNLLLRTLGDRGNFTRALWKGASSEKHPYGGWHTSSPGIEDMICKIEIADLYVSDVDL